MKVVRIRALKNYAVVYASGNLIRVWLEERWLSKRHERRDTMRKHGDYEGVYILQPPFKT